MDSITLINQYDRWPVNVVRDAWDTFLQPSASLSYSFLQFFINGLGRKHCFIFNPLIKKIELSWEPLLQPMQPSEKLHAFLHFLGALQVQESGIFYIAGQLPSLLRIS